MTKKQATTKTKVAAAVETANSDPRNSLMLVRMSISAWSPRKYDKKASDELARIHGAANADAIGRFNKVLIDLDSIKPLQRALSTLRLEHYKRTTIWTDDGVRLLPAAMYLDYTKVVREAKAQVETLAHEFCANDYAREREAARKRLNGLFNEDDYPSSLALEQRFGVRVHFEPLPNPQDARLWGLGREAIDEIQADVERSMKETLGAAQKHVADQVKARADEFVDKVRSFTKGKDAGGTNMLYETAVENLREIVRTVLGGLNVTGDADLTKAATELDDALKNVIVDKLRNSKTLCLGKIDEVEAITKRFAGVFGGAT